jgi:hypothetical protein
MFWPRPPDQPLAVLVVIGIVTQSLEMAKESCVYQERDNLYIYIYIYIHETFTT